MDRPTAIWMYDDSESSYVDRTDGTYTDADITFLEDSSDSMYIGLDSRFTGFYADLSTNGSYEDLAYYYYAGGFLGWKKLSLIDSYSFSESKYIRWNLPKDWVSWNFVDTDPESATPPDNIERYWIKVTAGTVSTAAVISKIRLFPYACYVTPDEVNDFLQIKNYPFTETSRPTLYTVENMIRKAEARIDYKTKKSWRFNVVSDSGDSLLVDYNRYGVYLRRRNFFKIYSVQLWNGGSWETLTEGRENDYFINYDLGMIYFTRMFLLPAVYGMTGRYFHYGFGEFKNNVKVDYAYGRDKEKDEEFEMAKDAALRLTALQLLQHHDYSTLIVSGTDKVTLESKVRLLSEEAEAIIEELSGIILY